VVKGKGGPLWLWSNELGLYGGNGIVAAQLPIAAAVPPSPPNTRSSDTVIASFGDGAADEAGFTNR